ncbi:hypothetical protein [Planktothrix agardhii]|jgi:hypothetical protein|uniref:hypothetical protein n=1 Tax=Planktothrix agardhii TaxID=1160 RepID=UPI001D0A2577|nr:hypothetical protein [Planktothrix agardhii]MCB8750123.1 hypothetical protein [Planktothrix agardhii 1810]MCF3608820.1 hypothetical protein [Planktothrix agardhii 1033]
MTQLFNLESYIKLCQYAYQFDQNPDELIHSQGNLPRRYKQELITEYGMTSYRVDPVISNHRSQQLEVKTNKNNFLGEELTQTGIQRLFIIRDTIDLLTLSTSQFLNYQETYLYQSAYYYWNYYQQLKHLNPDKPLIFIDLDCFECDRLIPIQRDPEGIPILNTREPLFIQTPFNTVETYNQICRDIAIKILTNFFPNSNLEESAIAHLQKYLQKIAIFEQIPSELNTESISILVEIMYSEQIYYKQVQLNLADIENIVNSRVNFSDLEKIVDSNFHWILISQYNRFPIIKQRLPQFLCVSSDHQTFPREWEEKKQNSNFPLFGIYLDTIEFAIGNRDKNVTQWIKLSEQTISYEGVEQTLTGIIPETNEKVFRIPKNTNPATLPIRVNGKDYLKNQVPQSYEIFIENFPGTEDIEIEIKFILRPDAPPQLKVSDISETYKITSKLVDRKEQEVKSFGYIPYQQIDFTRKEKSSKQIQKITNSHLIAKLKPVLEQIFTELENPSRPIDYNTITQKIRQVYIAIPKSKSLQYINVFSSEAEIQELRQMFNNPSLKKIPTLIIQSYPEQKQFIGISIKFIGKLYGFSETCSLYENFQDLLEMNILRGKSFNSQYSESLARTAITESQQQQYFSLFNSHYRSSSNQYLWGYARILLWYYNFQSKAKNFNYKNHFLLITNYLLSKPANQFTDQYKQNAFLALCYLLTFREIDQDFFTRDSQEKQQAIQVIKHFKDEEVMLNQVSRKKSLNQLFAELIEGKASQSDIDGMIQAS